MRRSLSDIELSQIQTVFGGNIHYPSVSIVEGAQWPNTIDRIGAKLRGEPPALSNAITIGNRSYFPVSLRTSEGSFSSGQIGHFAWLIHEMTHVWQFQHIGFIYFLQALWAQIRLGKAVYDYGGEQGLRDAQALEKDLQSFNPEQQGDIVRDYYIREVRGMDTSAWEPFIAGLEIT